MGATSNPRPGIRAEGAPDSSIRWAPAPILELITLRSNRRPPLFSWTAVRCAVALSCTLSCLVVVTHPVPPVCDQCLRRECLRLTPGRSLLLRLFVSSILRLSEDRIQSGSALPPAISAVSSSACRELPGPLARSACRAERLGGRPSPPPLATAPCWPIHSARHRRRCACFLARRWTSAEKTASLWGPDSAKIARAS